MKTPFLGPAYTARSPFLANNRLVNLYPSIVEGAKAREVGAFYTTPGLTLKATVGGGPIRGMAQTGDTALIVSGAGVWQLTSAFTSKQIGTIGSSSGPVSILWNGSQAAIFDQLSGYLVTGSVSPISLPFGGAPGAATYQDGYGLVIEAGTFKMWQSNLYDLSTFDALKFGDASSVPDNIIALASLQSIIWVFKQTGTEFWQDVGGNNFAFGKVVGAQVQHGCVAPYSVTVCGDVLAWLGQDAQGQGVVYVGSGYGADRISTHAIEGAIASYGTISDAIGYAYQSDGHIFYVLTFPTGGATWVYDLTESRSFKAPMWHQRAQFSGGLLGRHQGNCFVFFAGLPLVGDYQSGNIYALDPNALTDNGAQRKWLRSWEALPQFSEATVRFGSLRIDMQTGINVPVATSPSVRLRWSQDGGRTWTPERIVAAGPIGATTQRVKFNRLGSTRRNGGLDRIFELSSTDQFPAVLVGAILE